MPRESVLRAVVVGGGSGLQPAPRQKPPWVFRAGPSGFCGRSSLFVGVSGRSGLPGLERGCFLAVTGVHGCSGSATAAPDATFLHPPSAPPQTHRQNVREKFTHFSNHAFISWPGGHRSGRNLLGRTAGVCWIAWAGRAFAAPCAGQHKIKFVGAGERKGRPTRSISNILQAGGMGRAYTRHGGNELR